MEEMDYLLEQLTKDVLLIEHLIQLHESGYIEYDTLKSVLSGIGKRVSDHSMILELNGLVEIGLSEEIKIAINNVLKST